MENPILTTHEQGLLTIVLNRPDKLNAMNQEVYRALDQAARFAAENTETVGCVLLRGAGRCFSTGNDLGDASEAFSSDEGVRFRNHVVEALAHLPMPVVAAVHGYCLTGGLEVALSADIIICGENARFGDTHAKFDLVSCPSLTHRLPKRIGRAKALELWWTGRQFGGREAAQVGLADLCVPDAELDSAVDGLIAGMLANSWRSLRGFKHLANVAETIGPQDRVGDDLGDFPRMGPDTARRLAERRK